MYAEQGEGSNGWQGAGEARSNGWPLGLQQSLQIGRRRLGEGPSFFNSTPSVTSDSSSDLDTESTGSFFPEKSTTLGSLIGIQSSSHIDQSQVPADGIMESERRKSTGAGARSSSLRSRTSWCPMLGCRGGSNREALGMSPSLAHLLEEERKATGSQRQASDTIGGGGGQAEYDREEGTRGSPSLLVHKNTLFDEEGILPPHPSGAPLKLILQHTSPSTSYLSADWNVFNGRHPHHNHNRGGGGGGGGEGPSHAKFPTFWPNLCGRLGTGLA